MTRLKRFLLGTTAVLPQRRWFQWPRDKDGKYVPSIDKWADNFKGKYIGKGVITGRDLW